VRRVAALFWRRRISGTPKRRAGGVTLRTTQGGRDEVLLVSSRKNPQLWIVPAGTVERGETLADAALREVCEEAGLCCDIERLLGTFHDPKSLAATSLYLMSVRTDRGRWEDQARGRQRRWWPLHDDDLLKSVKPRDHPALRQLQRERRGDQHRVCSSS